MTVRIILGDVREKLAELPDESVHCVVTSPPYFGLRDYGTASWEGGDPTCDHRSPTMREGRNENRAKLAGSAATNSAQLLLAARTGCGKCGATRTDKQIGLEPTPAEFVAVMVEVFREVRRVLRADGTLWLNLGDSYANDTKWGGSTSGKHVQALQGNSGIGRQRHNTGLKAKDMIGIPWRVAFALQQPYYTGNIKSEADRIWLAAMIDGEGCMFLHKRKIGQNNGQGYERKNDSFGAGLEVANTHKSIVDRCLRIAGRGSICRQDKDRKQPLYRWNLRSNECREVIRELYPHLVAKQHQARLLLGCPSSGLKAEAAHIGLMALHNGQPCATDFPAPESMFEPGWYLRQDLIWSKLNPMPESVTDRCTKAHEYLFLLSKSARYHYDAEAIAEAVTENTVERLSQPTLDQQQGSDRVPGKTNGNMKAVGSDGTRNRRSVWTVATQPLSAAHFATFPPALIEPCIKAGCPKDCCAKCGAPVVREVERTAMVLDRSERTHEKGRTRSSGTMLEPPTSVTTGWLPSCSCNAGVMVRGTLIVDEAGTRPGVVLDPFGGAGTTGLVADRLQRDAILIELNPAYAAMMTERIVDDGPLFATITA